MAVKKVNEVFGVTPEILPDSYVDRGALDAEFNTLLGRSTHIAVRGESKCGKTWLRQSQIETPIIVQCRLERTVVDVYVDALSQLGIEFEVSNSRQNTLKGTLRAVGEFGSRLLAKAGIEVSAGVEDSKSSEKVKAGHDINDLRFIADILRASGRRLVVEDFHYLSLKERRRFAFDLKALWDYKLFVVIVGVWSQSNMLLYLNPDLSGRVREISIFWSDEDLERVIEKGAKALNLEFSTAVKAQAIADCFSNVGILQSLILSTLDELGVEASGPTRVIDQTTALTSAAMAYADQLNPLYQQFAARVSSGIRGRKDSTGIYAHAMAVILGASDEKLIRGLPANDIFEVANARQSRIQKGNLKTVLGRFESLQVDQDGRGLVLSYNEATSEITVVDRQLLLYRRYLTVKWPWEDLIAESE